MDATIRKILVSAQTFVEHFIVKNLVTSFVRHHLTEGGVFLEKTAAECNLH